MELIILLGLVMSMISNYAFLHVLTLCLHDLDRMDFKNQLIIITFLICSLGGVGVSTYSFVKSLESLNNTPVIQAEAEPNHESR